MATLVSLTLSGFRSFREPSHITFPEKGLVLIAGRNKRTGGSSGSGKSTIAHAISYLLGYCPYPATRLRTRGADVPLDVVGVFRVKEGELQVSRSDRGLELILNGTPVGPLSAKQMNEKLQSFMGLSPTMMNALTYRRQKSMGLFVSMTDLERKEFLTELLGLDAFEKAVEVSQKRVAELEPKCEMERSILESLRPKYRQLKSNPPAPKSAPVAVYESQLAAAQAQLQRNNEQVLQMEGLLENGLALVQQKVAQCQRGFEERIERAKTLIAELEDQQPDLSKVDYTRAHEIQGNIDQGLMLLAEAEAEARARQAEREKERRARLESVSLLTRSASKLPAIQARIAQKQQERAGLLESKCSLCERPWAEAFERVSVVDADIKQLEVQAQEAMNAQKALDIEVAEVERLRPISRDQAVEELNAAIAALRTELEVEQTRIAGDVKLASKAIETDLARAQQELQTLLSLQVREAECLRGNETEKLQWLEESLETLERDNKMVQAQVNGIQATLSRVRIDNAREEERQAQYQKQLEELERDIAAQEAGVAALTAQLAKEQDFQRLVGREGFLGSIFDEVLWEISDETNSLLAKFPNVAGVALRFVSETTTQKGVVQRKIVPTITVDGIVADLESGLSGGMGTAVELAIDLAVARVVSRRAGVLPSWLLLDEAFVGLGPVELEPSAEVLKDISKERLVLVIDHASEFQGLFEKSIVVEFDGRDSKVVEA